MIDYQALSDRDIDRLVLNVVYGVHANDKDIQGVWARGGFKYTTNASEAWSIITENRISIYFDETIADYEGEFKQWVCATSTCQKFQAQYQSNPLRAAMIVFLMMQENKQ